jgi:hypothetical protein
MTKFLFLHAGQTGAGKTYTMRALMQLAADDIFTHIQTNPAREFLLRMVSNKAANLHLEIKQKLQLISSSRL